MNFYDYEHAEASDRAAMMKADEMLQQITQRIRWLEGRCDELWDALACLAEHPPDCPAVEKDASNCNCGLFDLLKAPLRWRP